MTIEERQQEYELKLNDNKLMRKLLDENTSIIKFNIDIVIKTFGDVIFYGILKRLSTYYEYNGVLSIYNNVQCYQGRRRTIEDIYLIQRSYGLKFPYKQVKQCLESLVEAGLIEQVFCKSTYTRTHGKVSYTTTIDDINEYLNKLGLNERIIKKKLK